MRTVNVSLRSGQSVPLSAAQNDANLSALKAGIALSTENIPDGSGNGQTNTRVASNPSGGASAPNSYLGPGSYTEVWSATTLSLPLGSNDVILETYVAASGRVHQVAYATTNPSTPTPQIYMRAGTGTVWGAWQYVYAGTDAPITQQWQTGDEKLTLRPGVDAGWVVANNGTIGNAASGSSNRSNADTQALFLLLWNNYADALAPVVGGRGATALADYNANKRITLLSTQARAIVIAGSAPGVDDAARAIPSRAVGSKFGEDKHQQAASELVGHTHGNGISDDTGVAFVYDKTATGLPGESTQTMAVDTGGQPRSYQGLTSSTGGGNPANVNQPSSVHNLWIKL